MSPFPIVVLALVGCALSVSAYKTLFVASDRGQVMAVIRAWRWRYLPGTLAALFGVGLVCGGLSEYVPWTNWGWWHLLGGMGNPVFGVIDLGSSPAGLAISAALAVVFPLVFGVAAIREARAEEVSFRKGNQKKSVRRRVARAIWFGLVHFFIGIPIYACCALTVPGLWLDYVYQRGYERAAAKISQEAAQAGLLRVLRARERELQVQQHELEVQAEKYKRWPHLASYSRHIVMDGPLRTMGGTAEEIADEAAHGVEYSRFREEYAQAEEAGVNTAAAQHAFYNLLIIVIVEIAVLAS